MARRIRSNILTNRTSRLEQATRTKPYFVLIAPTVSLGAKVSGSWSVKVKRAPEWTEKFAVADDYEDANGETVMNYEQALARALDLARVGEGNSGAMCQPCEAYHIQKSVSKGAPLLRKADRGLCRNIHICSGLSGG